MLPLHVATPVWESRPLSERLGAPVLLKMEAFQPVGSFKARGIGAACRASYEAGARSLVCASGGNAGYAAAYAGRRLGLPTTVVVPASTPAWMQALIRQEATTLEVHGRAWNEAHARALEIAHETGAAYIHPFDDPRVWQGHATLIHELAEAGVRPGGLVLSVGGGGLLCGVLQGLHEVGWPEVPVLAVETEGAASLAAAMRAGHLVTLGRIDTVAVTLGASTVAAEALNWTRRHPVTSWVVSDREAVSACLRFADDHRVLVEPACGAALAAVYAGAPPLRGQAPLVVIVCGGAGVSLELLESWRRATEDGGQTTGDG